MLKCSVIASEISNLTDARYFAARGADYLLYNLSEIGVNEVMAIAEWVEGVKTLVHLDASNIHLIEEVIMRISPDAIGTSDKDVLDKILTYVHEGDVFFHFEKQDEENGKIIITHVDNIDGSTLHITPRSEVHAFSEIHPSAEKTTAFLAQTNDVGIILKGSSEEETGLKSFENLDEILDLLEH